MASVSGANDGKAKHVSDITGKFESTQQQGANSMAKSTKKIPDLRLLLVGRTGHGKSETANSIFGQKLFKASSKNTSVTRNCDWKRAEKDGKTIEVVDTPGFFDTKFTQDDIKRELYRALILSTPGFNAIAFVMKKDRFTPEMQQLVDVFFDFFGKEAEKFAFIIFTHIGTQNELKSFLDIHEDDYESNSEEEEDEVDWVLGEDVQLAVKKRGDKIEPKLKQFIDKCGGNMVIIDNKTKNKTQKKKQVEAILDQVEKIKHKNRNEYFRNVDFRVMDEMINIERQLALSGKSKGHQAFSWMKKVVKRFVYPSGTEEDENARVMEKARAEAERMAREKKEQEDREREITEKREREIQEAVQRELQRKENEKMEELRRQKEKEDKEREEKEKAEKEKAERELMEKQQKERERAEQEWAQKEKEMQDRLEREFKEKERAAKEKMERDLAEKERLERERLEKEQRERERLEKEKMERDRTERERIAEEERRERERKRELEMIIKRQEEEKERQEELLRLKQLALKDDKFVDDTASALTGIKSGLKYAAGKVVDTTVDAVASAVSSVGSWIRSWF